MEMDVVKKMSEIENSLKKMEEKKRKTREKAVHVFFKQLKVVMAKQEVSNEFKIAKIQDLIALYEKVLLS